MRVRKAGLIGFLLLTSLAAVVGYAPRGATQEVATAAALRIDRLVIRKGDRRLEVFEGERLVRTYQVAIGGGGEGAKVYAGDRRTPEGEYRVDRRHVSRSFHRFLHISYPNAADLRRYRQARATGAVPAAAGIGSAIGIHGSTRGLSLLAPNARWSWTDGCIAVSNPEIEELFESVVANAELEILP